MSDFAYQLAHLEHHTPMMQQYLTIKANYQHALMLYRMGDFYELFFDDAKIASDVLGITLTKRGFDKQGQAIAMAGVPFHSADSYIAKLIAAGHTVVICEQVDENPQQGIMQRKVVKTLTAGTLTDDNLIAQGQIPTVIALTVNPQKFIIGIAQLDLAQGNIRVQQLQKNSLPELQQALQQSLLTLNPSECLIDENLAQDWLDFLHQHLRCPIILQPSSHFLINNAFTHLCQHLQVTTLAGFGLDHKPYAQISTSVVLHYGQQTQQADLSHIQQIILENQSDFLQIDEISQQNLEIFNPVLASGTALISVINHCQTQMGKRLLVHHLRRPLLDLTLINQRQTAIEQLIALDNQVFANLQQILAEIADIERIGGRIGLLSAKPMDLVKLRNSLQHTQQLQQQLTSSLPKLTENDLLCHLIQKLPNLSNDNGFDSLKQFLQKAIVDEPPSHIRDGGMIQQGFDKTLDDLKSLHHNIEKTLEDLAQQQRQQYHLPNLKVGFNKVSGFYFELTTGQAKQAPSHFIRRQTLKNCERFITDELKTLETSYLSAQSQALALEKTLYEQILKHLQQQLPMLQSLSQAIAYVDVLLNWARLVKNSQHIWCRPHFLPSDTASLDIQLGRHLVVEHELQKQHKMNFVANDCQLGSESQPERLMLITGPNMGGKSTYMRQIALIVLLACCGSFVPAQKATLGRIERIFTRIGSADDLASGKSTFMVEMIETANIMNQANQNALVLMDEVGRGTSTQDGLAIAHACINYLADNIHCLSLFATHYFELTQFADQHPKMFNQHLVTQEINGQLLLLHKIAKGSTHRSFGLHVAKMAGVPDELLKNAQQFLNNHSTLTTEPPPNPSFHIPNDHKSQQLMEKLQQIQPDLLTPRQALEFIYSVKELLNND